MAVLVFVGFHAFEAFEGVVEDAGCGVEGEVLVRSYACGEPALGGGPFYREHVVWGVLVNGIGCGDIGGLPENVFPNTSCSGG